MSEILILEEGWLTEKEAYEAASWHAANTPLVDPLAYEAHWMLLRTRDVLYEAGQPNDDRLTVARFVLLSNLYRADKKSLSITDISLQMNVTLTNITQVLNGLVDQGLVERTGDEGDKRKTIARLTLAGEALIADFLPKVNLQIGEAWSGLSGHEKRVLVHLLAKVKLQAQIARGDEMVKDIEGFQRG